MVQKQHIADFFIVTNEEIEKNKKLLDENEERLQHIETLLNQWIQCVQHLPKACDEKMVRNFIRGSKFNLEIAKRKLEGYFLAKYSFPDFYRDRNPSAKEITQFFENFNVLTLPKLTDRGERMFVLSLENTDPDVFDLETGLKLFWMMFDFTLTCTFPVVSEIFIFDCKNVTSRHLLKFLSIPFKNSLTILRDAYACRVSQVHILNCPEMAEKIVAAVRPLLHEKVRNRIVIHKGVDTVLNHFPSKILPSDFGGDLNSLRYYTKKWQEILVNNYEWFHSQSSVKIIGKPPKRVEKFMTNIGVEGSFRQLNID